MDLQNPEIYIAVITIVTGLIAILAIFVTFVVVTQKQVIKLHKKLLKAEILSMEKERERVANDLHDSLGSTLSALALLNDQVEVANEESEKLNKKISNHLREANEHIRQISRDLAPRFFAETTVQEVVMKATNEFLLLCDDKGIQLIVQVNTDISLSKENHLHLFRIVHELLNNGYKHSQASIISLSCILKDHFIKLTYTDNGIGYDTQTSDEGLGLSNIQNRISLLDGNYSVESGTGRGTEILLRIPV